VERVLDATLLTLLVASTPLAALLSSSFTLLGVSLSPLCSPLALPLETFLCILSSALSTSLSHPFDSFATLLATVFCFLTFCRFSLAPCPLLRDDYSIACCIHRNRFQAVRSIGRFIMCCKRPCRHN
jgi:hypothetical protein